MNEALRMMDQARNEAIEQLHTQRSVSEDLKAQSKLREDA
jgi:hypothetical protein